jgi:hypothetical protein
VSGEPASHHHGARSIAAVHRAWADRIDEALALGAPDRRAPAALPHTLVHGDFHAGNVLGSTILDGSDAAVANPLHDLNHYLLHRDPAQRDALVATYAEASPAHDVAVAAAACEAETYEYIARSSAGINGCARRRRPLAVRRRGSAPARLRQRRARGTAPGPRGSEVSPVGLPRADQGVPAAGTHARTTSLTARSVRKTALFRTRSTSLLAWIAQQSRRGARKRVPARIRRG